MRLIFVRHGEPDYEKDSLTIKGFREADILATRTKRWKPDAVFCSPMGRAQDTMRPSLKNWPDITPVTYDWLKEFHYRIKDPINGNDRIAWDFMPEYFCYQEDLHDKDKWFDTDFMQTGDVKKHFDETKDGIDALLDSYGYHHRGNGLFDIDESNDKTLVFFCHFGITSVITSYLAGMAAPTLWQGFFMAPTAVTVFNSEERINNKGAFRVQYFGDVSHLLAANEPISHSGYFSDVFDL